LPHYYKVKIKDKWWFRLRVGYFKDTEQAKKFGEDFKRKEGLQYYVDKAKLLVDKFNDTIDIITAPNAVWFKSGKDIRILYRLDKVALNTSDIIHETRALISPTGNAIVSL